MDRGSGWELGPRLTGSCKHRVQSASLDQGRALPGHHLPARCARESRPTLDARTPRIAAVWLRSAKSNAIPGGYSVIFLVDLNCLYSWISGSQVPSHAAGMRMPES